MAFPWTLQRYIFRELGKTFLLTVVALTGVLGLGGGVLNMIKLGDATPEQLLRMMLLVLPISAALTLPIAALFSSAATYGRFSADNEFVACRSSGINMHVLFLPSVALSLFSAAVTFVLINFAIPGMVRNLNEFIGADLGTMIQRRLNRPRGLTLPGGYRVYADETTVDLGDANRISLHRVAYVKVDDGEWVGFGTARRVDLNVRRTESRIGVSAVMSGLSYYDRRTHQFLEEQQQTFPENEIPSLVPQKIKFLNLAELLARWRDPHDWLDVRKEVRQLRIGVGQWMVYGALLDDWLDGQELTLAGDGVQYVVRSARAFEPQETGFKLEDVVVREDRGGRRRSFSAKEAYLRVVGGRILAESGVQIELRDVRVTEGNRDTQRVKEKLGPVPIDEQVAANVAEMSPAELMAPTEGAGGVDPLAKKRAEVQDALGDTIREIKATVSERFAFSASAFVLVILGAVLGIIFRGAHTVTAFGISFVPSLFVIITIVMGKQMSQNAPTHLPGLLLMWSGILIVAGVDFWTLTRVLRR